MAETTRIDAIEYTLTQHSNTLIAIIDRVDRLEDRLIRFEQRVEQRFTALEQSVDRRFADLEQRMDRRFAEVDRQLDEIRHNQVLMMELVMARFDQMTALIERNHGTGR